MKDIDLAGLLVQDAAKLATEMRMCGVDAERKTSNADLVTAADRAAEKFMKDRLEAEHPEDGLLGEEGSHRETRNGRRWVIDPVDGTFNFISGLPAWCSAVALERDGEILAAAVHTPATNETWVAGVGVPTTRNGQTLEPMVEMPLSECGVATYVDSSDLQNSSFMTGLSSVLRNAATVRISGSGTCDLADVAIGRIGLWIQADCMDWDWLPGQMLVQGAGGATTVIERRGRQWHLAGSSTAVKEATTRLLSER